MMRPEAFLVRSGNTEILAKSASGGAFFEIASSIVANGGVVCGCRWNSELEAEHVVLKSGDDLSPLQGSKYVRSSLGNSLKECIELAKGGTTVFFSGTPCQCRALYSLAEKTMDSDRRKNIIICALICHGTARPVLWDSYKNFLENKYNATLIDVSFRDKSKGYSQSQCRYVFEDEKAITFEKKWLTYLEDPYIYATIVYDLALEPSCYNCKSKGLEQPFDLIIGDWHTENKGAASLGSSCAIALSEIGKNLIEDSFADLQPLDIEEVKKLNRPLVEHVSEPGNNREFCEMIETTNDFSRVERYFPKEYWVKKLLVKLGLFDKAKRMIGFIKKS